MIYTHKTIWTLILGIIMVAFGYLVQAGVLNPMIEFLSLAKFVGKPESPGEMIILPFVCGIIAIVVGLWQFAVKPKEGNLDYYLSTVAGVMFILIIAFVVKWGLDPLMHLWGKAAETAMKDAKLTWAFDFAKVMNLNYVVMGILAGIIAVNVFKIPGWAENGVRLVGRGRGGTGGQRQVHGNRLPHRHRPVVGRADDVHLPDRGQTDGHEPDTVRRLGRHRHPQFGAGGGRGAGLRTGRDRYPEGGGDIQHHAHPVPADHRAVAGGVVRGTRGRRPESQSWQRDLQES